MKLQLKRLPTAWASALAGAALVGLAGCGGGGGGGGAPAEATTTDVTTTVIDGALKNALVCVDKNANGVCDAGETQGRTDAAGNVTLAVPNADLGKYALVAMVGTDAVDADNGPVTVPFTLATPAGKPAVISPLTHLVHQKITQQGMTLAEAEASVKATTGVTVSLFEDFIKAPAPTDGTTSAKDVARMVVVTTQAQTTALAGLTGTAAADGKTISAADLDKAIQKKLLELLSSLVALLTDPANASKTPEQKVALVTGLITPAGLPTVVAINNQGAADAAAPPPAYVPAPGMTLARLDFTDAANWFLRANTASLAQNTPDANGLLRFGERRIRSNTGNLQQWNIGNDPRDQSNLHWSGSAWENCTLNFESTSTLRDPAGNASYNYCSSLETGKSNRVLFDVSGKKMIDVYNQIRAAGYTNFNVGSTPAAATAALGATAFPAGSNLFYQSVQTLSSAVAYRPRSLGGRRREIPDIELRG